MKRQIHHGGLSTLLCSSLEDGKFGFLSFTSVPHCTNIGHFKTQLKDNGI